MMIARIWHGVTSAADADEYYRRMRETGLPDYQATPGNRGAWVLRRLDGDRAHFLMLSLWESEEAIKRFAGKPIDVAKYYDFDPDFLLELEPHVTHYEASDR
jgi:heme-degrading monooxygenase HmoA